MKEPFFTKFWNKADKADIKIAKCIDSGEYFDAISAYFEKGYYAELAGVTDCSTQDTGEVADNLRRRLNVEKYGWSRMVQILKKMKKTEKTPEIEVAVSRFIDEIAGDFVALAKKSSEVEQILAAMSPWEKIEKGLDGSADNPVNPEDKIFMSDTVAVAILNRLKGPGNIKRLMKELEKILQ